MYSEGLTIKLVKWVARLSRTDYYMWVKDGPGEWSYSKNSKEIARIKETGEGDYSASAKGYSPIRCETLVYAKQYIEALFEEAS